MSNKWIFPALVSAAILIGGLFLWRGPFLREADAARFVYLNQTVDIPKWSPPPFTGEPNRIVPDHDRTRGFFDLAAIPTDRQISGSGVFPNQLFPIDLKGGPPDSSKENAGVGGLLQKIHDLPAGDAFALVEGWLRENPGSRWFAPLQHELMKYKFEGGYFEEAAAGWNALWDVLRSRSDLASLSLGNEVLASLLDLNTGLAQSGRLRELIADSEGRMLSGAVEGRVLRAKESVWLLDHTGAQNVMCGPLALNAIDDYKRERYQTPLLSKVPGSYIATGLPLTEVLKYSEENYKLQMQMASRVDQDSSIPVPSVMHLRREHYAALLETSGDGSQIFMEDRSLGFSGWVDRSAINKMSSGYFLVAAGPLPSGWNRVEEEEGRRVFGRDGAHGTTETGQAVTRDTPVVDGQCLAGDQSLIGGQSHASSQSLIGGQSHAGGQFSEGGMPAFVFHPMPGSIRIEDMPLTYSCPVGPQVVFRVNYNDLDSGAPASAPTFSNVGLTWSTDWVAWVEHISGTLTNSSTLRMHVIGGGVEVATYTTANGYFGPSDHTFSTITRTGTSTYTRTFPDGSKEVYNTPDSAGTPTRVFLTQRIDPAGNTISFTYDANHRLIAVTDAIGQVTTLQYNHPTDIYKITSVTDPFSRTASLGYNAAGQLTSITDQINLTSTFTYAADGFIGTMATPYGTTTFTKVSETVGSLRVLQVTDPVGDKERLQYIDNGTAPVIPTINTPPSSVTIAGQAVPFYAETPSPISPNGRLEYRNCFYWSKKAMRLSPNDPLAARQYRFYTDKDLFVVPIIEAIKEPYEDRVWFDYPGAAGSQKLANGWPAYPGQGSIPEKTLRVLSDGKAQLVQTYYNALGNVTKAVDPLGRTTEFTYGPNNSDLVEVRQTTGGVNERLAAATYNSQRLPLTVTDAAGQVTTFTYNARGQILTAKNAKNETTTFSYNPNGYLLGIDGPLSGTSDTTSFTYDAFGRTRTITGPDGYVLTFDYDSLDRITKVTFPDATFEQYTYDKLDCVTVRDRLARNTTVTYTPVRQLASITDPANRTISYDWCKCGALQSLTDALGRTTHWNYDAQGRLTSKEYADGSKVSYQYEQTTSRLKQRIDEKGQVTLYIYNVDDTLQSVSYPNAQIATPTVSYIYDTNYRRPISLTDGNGITNYTYLPITSSPSLGAGQLASIDGPWVNDTIAYIYDELGRVTNRSINGVAQTSSYDAAGRVTNISNTLGTFTYAYDGATYRLASATHSAGLKSVFTYFPNNQDRRLQRITNLKPDGVTPLSVFDYTYDADGRILSWKQQQDNDSAGAKTWSLGYDNADQLTSALITGGTSYSWTYDAAGNRKTETFNGTTTSFDYNSLNESIDTSASLPNTTYEWDAENRLTSVNQGANRTEFSYNGLGRRVGITEKVNGNVASSARYLWCGLQLCERRDATGTTTQQGYFAQGLQGISGLPGGVNLYTADHLGSVRELVDPSGTLKERVSYDPWGKPTFSNASPLNTFAFTRHFFHSATSLQLAPFRSYSPSLARWLSRDPLEESATVNLYSYSRNDPVRFYDPLGLCEQTSFGFGGTLGSAVFASLGINLGFTTEGQAFVQVQGGVLYGFGFAATAGPSVGGSVGLSLPSGVSVDSVDEVQAAAGPYGFSFDRGGSSRSAGIPIPEHFPLPRALRAGGVGAFLAQGKIYSLTIATPRVPPQPAREAFQKAVLQARFPFLSPNE